METVPCEVFFFLIPDSFITQICRQKIHLGISGLPSSVCCVSNVLVEKSSVQIWQLTCLSQVAGQLQ